MRDQANRGVLMLASSSLSLSEIKAFASWIERQGPDALASLIGNLRDADFAPTQLRSGRAAETSYSRNTLEKVANLLLNEARLSKREASASLVAGLKRVKIPVHDIPAYEKISFDRWLMTLTRHVPESALLHVASQIRNERVHRISDWPLLNKSGND